MGWIISIAIGCIILGIIGHSDLLSGCGCGCLSALAMVFIIAFALVIGAFIINPVLGVFILIILIFIFFHSRRGL